MATSPRLKRTAVLAVHGMGIQRPMETVRGIVNAVWLEEDDQQTADTRFWSHPEPSGNDIDLTVITTDSLRNSDRRIDFHEFYWSHLMTETKALAVLLWLFELQGTASQDRNADIVVEFRYFLGIRDPLVGLSSGSNNRAARACRTRAGGDVP